MKRGLIFVVCLTIVLVFSSLGWAASFSADASYLLGKRTVGNSSTDQRGFLVGVGGEIYPNIILDGRFLNISDAEEEDKTSQSMLSGAVLYKILQDGDLEVTVGGGYVTFNLSGGAEQNGGGLLGKLGIAFKPMEKMNLVGDLGYAPAFKFDNADAQAFMVGRVSLSYEVVSQVSVQATVMRTVHQDLKYANTLYGGGIVLGF